MCVCIVYMYIYMSVFVWLESGEITYFSPSLSLWKIAALATYIVHTHTHTHLYTPEKMKVQRDHFFKLNYYYVPLNVLYTLFNSTNLFNER